MKQSTIKIAAMLRYPGLSINVYMKSVLLAYFSL